MVETIDEKTTRVDELENQLLGMTQRLKTVIFEFFLKRAEINFFRFWRIFR